MKFQTISLKYFFAATIAIATVIFSHVKLNNMLFSRVKI